TFFRSIGTNNSPVHDFRFRKRNFVPLTMAFDRGEVSGDAPVDLSIFDRVNIDEHVLKNWRIAFRKPFHDGKGLIGWKPSEKALLSIGISSSTLRNVRRQSFIYLVERFLIGASNRFIRWVRGWRRCLVRLRKCNIRLIGFARLAWAVQKMNLNWP